MAASQDLGLFVYTVYFPKNEMVTCQFKALIWLEDETRNQCLSARPFSWYHISPFGYIFIMNPSSQ